MIWWRMFGDSVRRSQMYLDESSHTVPLGEASFGLDVWYDEINSYIPNCDDVCAIMPGFTEVV